jgi:hypothetical protein
VDAGDVDGDGLDDLLVGATVDSTLVEHGGSVHLFLGADLRRSLPGCGTDARTGARYLSTSFEVAVVWVWALVACSSKLGADDSGPAPASTSPVTSPAPADALGCASEASLDLVCTEDGEVQLAAFGPFGCFAARLTGMQLEVRFELDEVVDGGVLMRAWRLADPSGTGTTIGADAPDPFYFHGDAPLVDPTWPGWVQADPPLVFAGLTAPALPLDLERPVFIDEAQDEQVARATFSAADGTWSYADGSTDGAPVDVRGCAQVPAVLWPVELDR